MSRLPTFRSVKDHVQIRGFSQRVQALVNPVDVRAVVSALRFNHFDPAGREITDIGNFQKRNPDITVRLDRQANTTAGAANFQVQVNDVALEGTRLNQAEKTTIAQVILPAAVYRAAMTSGENARAHLENIVRSALLESYSSPGLQYTIDGG